MTASHRNGRRSVLAAIVTVIALVAAACSTSPSDGKATAEPEGATSLDHSRSSADAPPADSTVPSTTSCPPYRPALPGSTGCPDYDAADDDDVVTTILSGESVPIARTETEAPQIRVLAVGDSILAEAHGYLVPLADAHGVQMTVRAVGGTAPCDWVDQLGALLDAVDPDLVLFSFSGNAFTPCMADRPPGSDGFYTAYRDAAAQLNELAAAAGSEVWWMEVPPFEDAEAERHRVPLHDLYLGAPHTAGLVPTRALFESATGGFATELGCWFPWEACPSVRVRADDGIHLDNPRTPWGSLRYAVSILAFTDCWADGAIQV